MSFFSEIANIATGGLAKEILNKVTEYFPPDMSNEKKAMLQLELERIEFEREKMANDAATQEAGNINKRLEIYEGTAKDLLAIPIIGGVMLFLRGSQRTVWGFATIAFDYHWFVDQAVLDNQQQLALIIINVLVLGFLFGERAIKNIMPLLTEFIGAKRAK